VLRSAKLHDAGLAQLRCAGAQGCDLHGNSNSSHLRKKTRQLLRAVLFRCCECRTPGPSHVASHSAGQLPGTFPRRDTPRAAGDTDFRRQGCTPCAKEGNSRDCRKVQKKRGLGFSPGVPLAHSSHRETNSSHRFTCQHLSRRIRARRESAQGAVA
jgi:hypothetical protein